MDMEPISTEIKDNRFLKELLTEEDKMLTTIIREFVDDVIIPIRRDMEKSALTDFKLIEDLQRRLLPLGLQGGMLPEEYGGMNMTRAVTACLLCEEFARGEVSSIAAVAAGAWAKIGRAHV